MNRSSLTLILLAVYTVAIAANPGIRDFATGFDLEIEAGLPAQELVVPDAVYSTATRADLGDLRVFNGGDIVVPHALCKGPAPIAGTVREQALPVFILQGAKPASIGDTQVQVQVQTPGGTAVHIQEPGPASASDSAPAVSAYVVDARDLAEPIGALKLSWSTEDGASEVAVRVEASNDLDRWRTMVERTMLLRSTADGRVLERTRIDLPAGAYRYLRLERSDGGPPPRIDQVTAELRVAAAEAAPFWFAPAPLERTTEHEYVFETGRRAPVQAARVKLPSDNMVLQVALASRATPETPWHVHWQGQVSSVAGGNSPEQKIRFAPTVDREWRLVVLRGAETLGTTRPALELAYHPARLRFLAQGTAPYRLAFGSARVSPAEVAGCDSLLSASSGQGAHLMGQAVASPGSAARFGGSEALTPPREPTPVRLMVLWGVLIAGVAVLIGLAISLMRRLQNPAVRS